MTKILSDIETRRELVRIFKVSSQTVRDALNCKYNSDLAKRIRKRALDMGCRQKGTETVKYL
ncbi:MAG: GntR family transcriptional regulator [Bacteroidales bacterium]